MNVIDLKKVKDNCNISFCYIIIFSLYVLFDFIILFLLNYINKLNVFTVCCFTLISLIILFLYLNLLIPISKIYKGLSLIDFDSNIVDFTYIDRLEPSGLFGVSVLVSKVKYLMDIIEERIVKYNKENYKSEHDSLSGCYNRVHLERVKEQYENQLLTYVIFIDVNNLKKMNDIYGHEAGDLKFWESYGDVYRMGGDEFMVVLSNLDFDYCTRLLKQWYPTVGVLNKDTDDFKCILSYGVATCRGICNFDKLQKAADAAMYNMKVKVKKQLGEEMR